MRAAEVVLQNELVRVVCVPGHGMLLTEMSPLRQEVNLLWQREDPPLQEFTEPAAATAAGDPFDETVFAGGWFGMFPNAGIPGVADTNVQLHGTFPRHKWEVIDQGDTSLSCRLRAEGFSAVRTVSLDGASVRVATTVTNEDVNSQEVSFGEHPCFDRSAFAGGRVELTAKSSFITPELSEPGSHRFVPGQQFGWPEAQDTNGRGARVDTIPSVADGTHDHLCIELDTVEIVLHAPDLAGKVIVRVDIEHTPYLLFWRHFLPAGSPWAGDVFGIETMSTPGRTRDDARQASALTTLQAGGFLTWQLELLWQDTPARALDTKQRL